MKKNAVVVASIMFAAGSAANKAADQTPSLALQYDPAYRLYHADSSVRGGSNEARGYDLRGVRQEPAPHPINPALHADSSIRGGSKEARSPYPYPSTARSEHMPDQSLAGSANWNPSDDLLPDATQATENPGWVFSNEASSIGGAAASQSGSDFSNTVLDDISVGAHKDDWSLSIVPPIQNTQASGGRELNSSDHLEKNISGEINLDSDAGQQSTAELNSSTAVGGPGSTQTGTSTSSPEAAYSQSAESSDAVPGDNSRTSRFLFRNNRAQGVGSAVTGDFAIVSDSPAASSDQQLAQRVKTSLANESTGTFGLTQSEVMRNIQVSSQGGNIILKGTVPTEKDKRLIEVRAREINGVNKVDNQLTVMAAPEPALRDLKIGRDLEDTIGELNKLNEHRD